MNVEQLRLLLIAVRRRVLLICSCTGLMLTLGIVYCVVTPRIYEATASLLVEYNNEQLNKSGSDLQQQSRFDDMNTQVRIIQSPLLLDRAIGSLQPFQMDPELAKLPAEDRRTAVGLALGVSSPRGARLIHLGYRSPTPEAATAMVQAVTDSYLKFVNETHRSSAREVLEVLTRQKNELEGQLQEADQQVAQAQEDANVIMEKAVRTSIHQKRMATLHDELLKAQIMRMHAEGTWRQANASTHWGQGLSMINMPGRFFERFYEEILGVRSDYLKYWESTAKANLINDEVELQRLAKTYGPNHPHYDSVKKRIELQRAFLENPDAARSGNVEKRGQQLMEFGQKWAKQQLADALAIEKELQDKIANEKEEAGKQNAKYVRLQMMESKQERLKSFYDVVLKRMKELDIGEHLSQINVTVIGTPTLTKKPVSPRVTLIIFFALVGGAVAGVGLALVLDRLDNKFNGPDDIQQLLEAPIIGNVPAMRAELECAPAMLMARASHAVEAEAFRSIRTWLFFAKDAHLLSVSSPLQGDGKSTIICNIGSALAQAGKKALIIDCDLRRPRQQSAWSLPPTRGISYLLQKNQVDPEAIAAEVCPSGVDLLDVLPAGPIPAHPAELLEKPELLDILQWAKANYTYVLIDAPPLIPVADTGTIARLVDGMILVVNVNTNGRGHAFQAKGKILTAGGTLLGVVANGISKHTSYGYSDGGYGYEYSYGQKNKHENAGQDGGATARRDDAGESRAA